MKAAAELPNDMWQAISESERSSNGKWEPRRGQGPLGNAQTCSSDLSPSILSAQLLETVLGYSQCPSPTEGGEAFVTHFPLYSLFTVVSQGTVCRAFLSAAHPPQGHPLGPNSMSPNFLPRPASCSQPQCLVSAPWPCPSQLIFMDLTLGRPKPIGSSWP